MAKSKIKGGGTTKACLPAAKVKSMSKAEREAVIRAKKSAGKAGKYKRSPKSYISGTSSPGDTLRDWFKKDWINVETGEPCGASRKKKKKSSKKR